jgi:hypothetical protein
VRRRVKQGLKGVAARGHEPTWQPSYLKRMSSPRKLPLSNIPPGRDLLQEYRTEGSSSADFSFEGNARPAWRKVALALGLLLFGIVLLFTGVGLWVSGQQNGEQLTLALTPLTCHHFPLIYTYSSPNADHRKLGLMPWRLLFHPRLPRLERSARVLFGPHP